MKKPINYFATLTMKKQSTNVWLIGRERNFVRHCNHDIPGIVLKRLSPNEFLFFEINLVLSVMIRIIIRISL